MLRKCVKLTMEDRSKILGSEIVKRKLSFVSAKKAVQNYFQPQTSVPYSHICQIGDPGLRVPAQYVEPDVINTPTFQRIIKKMVSVMRSYESMGLSANQVGLPYRIFIAEVTQKHLDSFGEKYRKGLQIEKLPLTVCINPEMKVLDYKQMIDTEQCLSIMGYTATIPRASAVEVKALDPTGKSFTLNVEGWSARIVQHEMDHLQGKLYVDRMDPKTFSCMSWSFINVKRGNAGIRFYPKSWLRRFMNF